MRAIRFAAAVAALLLTAAPGALAQQADVLAPARHGDLQCYEPDVQAKTCAALASYTFDAHGQISNVGDVVIYPDPVIVMHMASPVTVRAGGAVCGPLRPEDIAQATFTINGQAVPEEQAQTMRSQFSEQLAPMIGVDSCTTYTPQSDGSFRADATIGGTPHPEMTQTVIWVHPSDGYHPGVPPSAAPGSH